MPLLPWTDTSRPPLSPGKVLAVGKNYAEHVAALGEPAPTGQPLVFMKPREALVPPGGCLWYPPGCQDLHPEAELVLVVGATLRDASPETCLEAIAGYAAGLDMTDRGWQRLAKQKGWPWERAKAYDGSAAVGRLVPRARAGDWRDLRVVLHQDGREVQRADPNSMTWTPGPLLSAVSGTFTLSPGDLVFTGAPAGTAAVAPGCRLELEIPGFGRDAFTISARRPAADPGP